MENLFYIRMGPKFYNILVRARLWCIDHVTEAVQAVVG